LSHTLWNKNGRFDHVDFDLIPETNITLLGAGGVVTDLTILTYEWAYDYLSIIFYTNNPLQFDYDGGGYNSMELFKKRFLTQTSNFDLNLNFQITMTETAVASIMASTAIHKGSLYLSYNIN
jgi:hypothetical protein